MRNKTQVLLLIFLVMINFKTKVYAENQEVTNSKHIQLFIGEEQVLDIYSDDPKLMVEIDTVNDSILINQQQNNPSTDNQNQLQIFGQIIPIGIMSGLISAVVALAIYYLNRQNSKKQIKFDIALKHLLPELYVPLIEELINYREKQKEVDFNKLKKVIENNMAFLSFAPKKINRIIGKIYSICKDIKKPKDYLEKESELVKELEKIEKTIIKRFGALKG